MATERSELGLTEKAVSRRSFLKTSAVVGGGLVVSFFVPAAFRRFAFAQEGATPMPQAAAGLPSANAFLRIGADESVTVLLSHSEMGQGIWTTLPMMVNEELDADWSRFRVEHAPAAPAYFSTVFPIQMTGGSTTTWSELDRYRQVGAVARVLLVSAAATQWGVKPGDCRTEKGFVICGDRRASYGSLADAAAKLPQPDKVDLKPPEKWTVIGQPTRRLDTPEKITGRAKFGMDVQMPGLLTAVVAHPPTFGGTVKSFDASAAKAVPGVRGVVEVPSGVAVVADHFWAAKKGRDALKVQWDLGAHAKLDTAELRQSYRDTSKTAGAMAAEAGDAAKNLGEKALDGRVLVAVSRPRAHGAAQLHRQARVGCRRTLRGVDGNAVPDRGPAAGGGDLRPRARAGEDPHHLPGRRLRPAGEHRLGLRGRGRSRGQGHEPDGKTGGPSRWSGRGRTTSAAATTGPWPSTGWRGRWTATAGPWPGGTASSSQSIMAGSPFAGMIQDGIDPTVVEGASDSHYLKSIPHHRVELHAPAPGVPVLWWRSVGHSHTAFAVESFLDELAHAAKRDPLEFRLELLEKTPRMRAVLELAAEQGGVGERAAGRARPRARRPRVVRQHRGPGGRGLRRGWPDPRAPRGLRHRLRRLHQPPGGRRADGVRHRLRPGRGAPR